MVVVGAGPAGACTASRLARRGLRVVLLDRARFPRDKPCGGGVTARGVGLIPADIGPVVERRVTRVDLGMGYASPDMLAVESAETMVHMTQRRRLDAHLAGAAAAAGADFRDGVRVRGLRHVADGVDVESDAGALLTFCSEIGITELLSRRPDRPINDVNFHVAPYVKAPNVPPADARDDA